MENLKEILTEYTEKIDAVISERELAEVKATLFGK